MELIAAAKARSLLHPIKKSGCILRKDVNNDHCVILELHKGIILEFRQFDPACFDEDGVKMVSVCVANDFLDLILSLVLIHSMPGR